MNENDNDNDNIMILIMIMIMMIKRVKVISACIWQQLFSHILSVRLEVSLNDET